MKQCNQVPAYDLKDYGKSLTLFVDADTIYICSHHPTESPNGTYLGSFLDGPVTEISIHSSADELQSALMEGFDRCNQYFLEEFPKQTGFEKHLRVRSWKKATDEKKCISVLSNIEGYHIGATERMKSGRYLGIQQFYLDINEGNEGNQLAEEVLKAVKISSTTLLDRKTKRQLKEKEDTKSL
ncbi:MULTISPECIES: hypothetical protein [unclassified Paenibacillus]|uniref:hypothetical protein n=1 Tax=unclassified Paenibacillus TaxID=185978 RepID=UPI00089C42B0|nr:MULTISPECIES: hypothetical protein [unclassified Paenibacillus]OMC72268.1 hypothetical protein BK126_09820 [Paenibacillus sp. FSL H7-0326]SDX43637.1 hypothetical protein SAMN05518848_107167 [Paenibacillus sp. PDC88]